MVRIFRLLTQETADTLSLTFKVGSTRPGNQLSAGRTIIGRLMSTIQKSNVMRGKIESDDGLVVYFNTLTERRTLPTEEELRENLPLCILAQNSDGTIYGIDICPQ